MVQMPSTIMVRVWPAVEHDGQRFVRFEVRTATGHLAAKDGVVLLGP